MTKFGFKRPRLFGKKKNNYLNLFQSPHLTRSYLRESLSGVKLDCLTNIKARVATIARIASKSGIRNTISVGLSL